VLGIVLRLSVVVLLVGLNGFFVAFEYALVSSRRTRIEQMVAQGNSLARNVLTAMDDPNRYISASQLSITVTSLALGWVGEPAMAALIEPLFERVLPDSLLFVTASAVGTAAAFTIITFFHLVMGEQVPKMFALQRTESTALVTTQVARPLTMILRPFISVVYWSTVKVLGWLGLKYEGRERLVYSVEELEMLVAASTAGGQLERSEQEMINRLLTFADLTAHQAMVPRTEIVGVPTSVTLQELTELAAREGRARYPVYHETLDDIVGLVYVKDLFNYVRRASGRPFNVRDITREALTMPESLTIDHCLAMMKARRTHMAIVIDEFGGTAGLLTLEDIMEVIVGEVQDEFERPETQLEIFDDGTAQVSGLVLIDEFNRRYDAEIDDPNFDTVGGFVFGQIGHKPELGDEVRAFGLVFRVEALDGLRVAQLHVAREQPVGALAEPMDGE
jgi:CBS domain containing-hemolysin-like protein